jgi:hypothetical protein
MPESSQSHVGPDLRHFFTSRRLRAIFAARNGRHICCTQLYGLAMASGKAWEPMNLRQKTMRGLLALTVLLAAASIVGAQAGAETFSATATVRTAGGATTTAPMTISVDRKMSQSEADRLKAAFRTGGAAELRKALAGIPPTGSVRFEGRAATPTRITLERPTDKGRLLTMVTDQPLVFLGAGVPGAQTKEGYDFAVIDIEVDANGRGSGTVAPAAKVTLRQDAFVVEDYASEVVRLTGVTKVK